MKREDQDQPETFCPKCNKFIRTTNFLIHDARCRGSNFEQPRPSTSHIRPGSGIFSSRMRNFNFVEEEQKIPCSFCGYPQTLLQLDTHPNQCAHRQIQCEACNSMFPMSLMQQHQMVCPAIQSRRRQNLQRFSPERLLFNPLMMPQQQRNPRRHPQRRMNPLLNVIEQLNQSQQRRSNIGVLINLLAQLHGMEGEQEANGVNQEQMKQFKITKYKKKSQEGDLCTICYCNFEEGQQMMNLPCKHIYHPQCIKEWLKKNHKCPVCKQSVNGKSQDQERMPPMGGQRIIFRFG